MLIPIGTVNRVPVTIMRVSQDPPVVTDGNVVHFDGKRYEIEVVDSGTSFVEGEQILLDFGEGETGRRRTRVEMVSGDKITVNLIGRPRPRDRRFFPRIEGYFSLEYQAFPPNRRDAVTTWLEHPHLSEVGETWSQPDPFVEFSATGIKFRAVEELEIGSWLRLRFKLPLLGEETYYCGGKVVRKDEQDGESWFAVALVDVDAHVSDVLMEYTKRCQDLVLGLDSLQEE